MIARQPYPGDVSDAEWEFVRPSPCLLPVDASRHVHRLASAMEGPHYDAFSLLMLHKAAPHSCWSS